MGTAYLCWNLLVPDIVENQSSCSGTGQPRPAVTEPPHHRRLASCLDAPSAAIREGVYTIKSDESDAGDICVSYDSDAKRCLDSDSNDRFGNNQMQMLACNETEYRRWRLYKLQQGGFNLMNKASGKCLDRDSFHLSPGGAINQIDCDGTAWQQWDLDFVRDH